MNQIPENGVYEIGNLYINENTHVVKKNDKNIKLTPTQFNILILLVKNRGMVFSMEKIYEAVWKEESYDVENTVMVHIRKLREKIEDNPREPKYIKTVWEWDTKLNKKKKKENLFVKKGVHLQIKFFGFISSCVKKVYVLS